MVAHRSPKPPVRVRILLPLPMDAKLCLQFGFLFYSNILFLTFYLIKMKFIFFKKGGNPYF